MAKGFTVKADAPKKKNTDDFNIAECRQLVRGKTIVFCLPGRGVSYQFLKSFVGLCFDLVQSGAAIQISQDYSSMVNFARCKCLGANVLRGPDQKPWDGNLKYDYQLWIASDIMFDTEKFYRLIDNAIPKEARTYEDVIQPVLEADGTEKKDEEGKVVTQVVGKNIIVDPEKEREIVAGWYCTEDGRTTSIAHWLEEGDFRKNGGVMNHETLETMGKRKKPFTCDYTGFGWVLIKNGVFENEQMKYPWFAPKMQVFESGEVQDMCGEDVSFCLDAIEAGFEIWCDPLIRVGHEKTRVI